MTKNDNIEKSVFISYRRTNQFFALAVYKDLIDNGYDVFMDYQNLGSGDFEQIIVENIRSRAHFLLLLTPTALERCINPGDVFRLEIETALENQRNIVPLMYENLDFDHPQISKRLTGKLAVLRKYNGLVIPATYFDEAMMRLRKKFLDIPITTVLHPTSSNALEFSEKQRIAISNVPDVKESDLLAEEWFERGRLHHDTQERIRHMNEVLKLKPDWGTAYIFRGIAKIHNESTRNEGILDMKNGIKYDTGGAWGYVARGMLKIMLKQDPLPEFKEAIRLDPLENLFYAARANYLLERGDLESAEMDFSKMIDLNSEGYGYIGYLERGRIRTMKGNFEGAIKDFDEAVLLIPEDYRVYYYRSMAYSALENNYQAKMDLNQVIDLNPDFADAYFRRGLIKLSGYEIQGALDDLTRVISLTPTYTEAYFWRAKLLEIKERYEETITDLEMYLELEGAKGFWERRKIKKQIKTLRKIVDIDSTPL